MVTTDNYECTWDLYKTIPSLNHAGQTVFDETVEFNRKHKANSMARLVDRRRAKVPVASMGFSIEDRIELLKLSRAGEDALAASRITDWLSPAFFETEFWYMWSTTFAFQPWHSASDRPLPVPRGSKNFAFISQFVEIADDVVFTVEYSVRAAQMAVYELLGIDRKIPPVTPHAESVHAQFEALLKAFKSMLGPARRRLCLCQDL
jgi:myosin-crossreactive antigen